MRWVCPSFVGLGRWPFRLAVNGQAQAKMSAKAPLSALATRVPARLPEGRGRFQRPARPQPGRKAMEVLTPLMIQMGINSAQATGNPLIFIPLHKGADGFLSDEQFRKFYWPTLREVILGLIEGGCIPLPAAEGGYTSRLEVVKDLPRGKTVWMIDLTDMADAKRTIGQNACLLGNVPSSLLNLGTPEEVRAYVKRLIEVAGKDGGLIICNGSFFDEAKPENVKAMVEAAKEYGVY
jgi:uroporphyrinogen-III decarboxylase